MLKLALFHLVTLLFFPVNLFLAVRDTIKAPKGISLTMRYVLLYLRLRQNKAVRSMRWAQSSVNRINAKASALYCTSFPTPPKDVHIREVKFTSPSLFSSTLGSSRHPWKFFLIEPTRAFPSKKPFVLYSHGGSFVTTFHDRHFSYLYELCQQTGATIFAHDYPRPPNGATHEETYAVLVELVSALCSPSSSLRNASGLAVDERHLAEAARTRTKLVFAGDSAGGAISLALCFELIDRKMGELLPEETILISPGLDGRLQDAELYDGKNPWLSLPACHTVLAAWKGPSASVTHHLVSPALAPKDLLRQLLASKTRITNLHGTADLLFPGSVIFQERVVEVAKEMGIEKVGERVRFIAAVGMPHDWLLVPLSAPEILSARTTIISVINSGE
ncbi:unnamed protein product [Tilletia laevis]|uniref:Alpha/beta hydrolase fold-3 domain-containing protein n=2 Tax=Tilletia TaxID=13289 RepID=A0A177UDI2_9BASI|nr:hypothetical protein CF336_g6054 [Tilletia laevis]KAE8245983.1 hypothetical protein A4X03_0g7364 [Tilletia caries]CAD6904381.1 unnamed protein product [Tilletia controversa]KAE8193288.1 hypothetical protein CF335_g5631 [Tilletia laevis]CAD6885196.1 unnamed protein product [Tilletia caries]